MQKTKTTKKAQTITKKIPKMPLRDYLDSKFWRFNIEFCVQYVYIDYHRLMMIDEADDANDAFDVERTNDIIDEHMSLLNELVNIVDLHDNSQDLRFVIKAEARFFKIYNSIMKRLLLQSNRIDYSDQPERHKNIRNYYEFLAAYSESVANMSTIHLESMCSQIDKMDQANAREMKKVHSRNKKKSKIVNIKDLALDRFSRDKHNGN